MKCLMPKRLFDILYPYRDVLMFVLTLFVADGLWKLTVSGDETGVGMVLWLGMDVTALFDAFAQHTADCVFRLVSLVRDTAWQADATTIRFTSGSGTTIAWSCTPLKQAFIWLCLMLTTLPASLDCANGAWRHQLWDARLWQHKAAFVLLGWLLAYGFNILRIFIIALVIEHHPELFALLHNYILKYAFYALLFLLWLLFINRLR